MSGRPPDPDVALPVMDAPKISANNTERVLSVFGDALCFIPKAAIRERNVPVRAMAQFLLTSANVLAGVIVALIIRHFRG
ncbi:MAG: hypothetical protein ACLR7Z_10640 [Bilophila wadsworthia]